MQIIENEHISCFDVDQTLFMHTPGYLFNIVNPYTNTPMVGMINNGHVELLKQHKARGMFIIVWSKAGAQWANAVVKKLKLEEYVDLILTKPDKYCDDLTGDKILGEHIYLK